MNRASRAPLGARGLKQYPNLYQLLLFCRAPLGARGLKHHAGGSGLGSCMSRPARGAWIETTTVGHCCLSSQVAPRSGRVD